MTAAPEPGTQDLAEKVARAHTAAYYQAEYGWPSWDDSPSPYRSDMLRSAGQWLAAIRAAGLAVVAQPPADEPRQMLGAAGGDGFEVDVASPDGRGGRVTAGHVPGFYEDHIVLDGETRQAWWGSASDARRDAARILAACDALDRLRAEAGGGDAR